VESSKTQEGFKAPYRGLPFKPPPLVVVVDCAFSPEYEDFPIDKDIDKNTFVNIYIIFL
jgi:hypothetical protein